MGCLGRMHEKRRRAGGRQGGGDLAGHMTALAHAADDDAAGDRGHDIQGLGKILAQAKGQGFEGGGLNAEDPFRRGDVGVGVTGVGFVLDFTGVCLGHGRDRTHVDPPSVFRLVI